MRGLGEVKDLEELRGRRFIFKDRVSAGRLLAEKLSAMEWFSPLILAIP